MREVLESTKRVMEKARGVSISGEALEAFAGGLSAADVEPPAWDHVHHYSGDAEDVAQYLLVVDTVNFCFFARPGERRWESNEGLSGYVGLAKALTEAVLRGVPLLDAGFLRGLDEADLRAILGGRGGLPLMAERTAALNELGAVLARDFSGRAAELAKAAEGSAPGLARLLAERLKSFRDTAAYDGGPVFFYKRAQLYAADLAGALGGRGAGAFRDLPSLTAFADYKLPQVLRQMGILRYSGKLTAKVDGLAYLPPGSMEEVEIRAATVQAVEGISRALSRRGVPASAPALDGLLWRMGQDESFRKKPYHRTESIYY